MKIEFTIFLLLYFVIFDVDLANLESLEFSRPGVRRGSVESYLADETGVGYGIEFVTACIGGEEDIPVCSKSR